MGNKFWWQKIQLVKLDSKIEESEYDLCYDSTFMMIYTSNHKRALAMLIQIIPKFLSYFQYLVCLNFTFLGTFKLYSTFYEGFVFIGQEK